MLNLAICEDDIPTLNKIESIVKNKCKSARVFAFDNLDKLDKKRDEVEFDIYLLDIDLGEVSGFTYAKSIRETNNTCKIAFITSYSDYSTSGYDIQANGYLLKPFEDEDIIKLLERLQNEIKERKLFITIVENYINIPIKLEEVNYIKVKNRKTYIYSENDIFETNESLSNLLMRSDFLPFLKVTRSMAINVSRIESIDRKSNKFILEFNNEDLCVDSSIIKKIINYKEENVL